MSITIHVRILEQRLWSQYEVIIINILVKKTENFISITFKVFLYYRCIGKEYRKIRSMKPEILLVNEKDLLAEGKLLAWLDLQCISLEELDQLGGEEYVSVCNKDGRYQGICIWFDVEFPDGSELSTSPFYKATHWKQTVIVLPTDIEVTKNEPIAFKLELTKSNANPRQYNIELLLLNAFEVEHEVPCSCHVPKCIVMRTYIEEHNGPGNEELEKK